MRRNIFAIGLLVCSCLITACAGDMSPVAPSSASATSANEVSTITGRVTARETHNGIAGAKVTVQAGAMRTPSVVTDASGFYSIPVKSGFVTVLVKADRYIDRSESVQVLEDTTRVDFQLMSLLEE